MPGPKWRRLIAAAGEPDPEIPFVSLTSEGVILIYGRDEQAIEAGEAAERPSRRDRAAQHAPVDRRAAARERISRWRKARSARPTGISAPSRSWSTILPLPRHPRAARSPSRRRATAPYRAATSCSTFPAMRRCSLRPICATAICAPIPATRRRCCARCSRRAISSALSTSRATSRLPKISARIRARASSAAAAVSILCPTGAIAPAGDHVAIDADICAGCGQCAAACPTGAAAYALPPADALMRKLRALLTVYREAGGANPDPALARRRTRRRADRCAGAPRRWPAGERAAACASTR